jgi:hypothetical protein
MTLAGLFYRLFDIKFDGRPRQDFAVARSGRGLGGFALLLLPLGKFVLRLGDDLPRQEAAVIPKFGELPLLEVILDTSAVWPEALQIAITVSVPGSLRAE